MHTEIIKCLSNLKTDNPQDHQRIDAARNRLMQDENADVADVVAKMNQEFGRKPARKIASNKHGRTGGRSSGR